MFDDSLRYFSQKSQGGRHSLKPSVKKLFQMFFIFTPNVGEDFQFDEHIFVEGLVQPATR